LRSRPPGRISRSGRRLFARPATTMDSDQQKEKNAEPAPPETPYRHTNLLNEWLCYENTRKARRARPLRGKRRTERASFEDTPGAWLARGARKDRLRIITQRRLDRLPTRSHRETPVPRCPYPSSRE